MKTLLIYTQLIFCGGVEKMIHTVVTNLTKGKYKVTILSYFHEENFYDEYPEEVEYYSVEKHFGGDAKQAFVAAYMRRFDIAVSMTGNQYMDFISKLEGPKKLAWIHHDYGISQETMRYFGTLENELECMKKFDHVVCVSPSQIGALKKAVGDPGNLCIRYNPIDENDVLKKAGEENITRNNDRILFLAVGRISLQKGYDRLLDICYELNKEGYEYDLWIIGGENAMISGGNLERSLLEKKERYKLDNVLFLGEKQNPYPYLKCADWCVSSALFETYNIVARESVICSTPVIATDYLGVYDDLTGDNECGIITDNNTVALYKGMEKILKDRQITEHYKQKAAEKSGFIRLSDRIAAIEELFDEE